ncbi:MAG: hypothetical protein KKF85_05380 [Gammaproteobacteria bacterium]|nr:hypothetical protein [Rhodocyclaceae bacterium]MBU3910547.1 hypothetical protein [Gammaproteobacteria bacterium]MBU4005028.1 hypothetical protein [Gammaproteobacteria bacterium]MBU4020621.1 hypothetical protein [Gammaproteobacteria bacterium]MBU4095697.1 hypothetical protein [Gammaproteobacteria bacterium]
MKLRSLLLPLLVAPLLAGCEIEPAAYLIDGGNHSLTVERKKAYFWSTGWELDLVVTRYPDCQRRYPLKKAGEKVRVDLYRVEPGAFILNQGKHWYVAETRDCRFQQFKEEPDEPGEYIGSFRPKDGELTFVPSKNDKE